MGNVVQSNVASSKQVAYLPFYATDIGDTNGTLFGQASTPTYIAPSKGSVLGFSGTLNGTLSTGSLQFSAMINGSISPAFDDATALMHVNQTGVKYLQSGRKANFTFAAGAGLGMTWQKSGTIAPTTRDGNFLLVVLYEEVQA